MGCGPSVDVPVIPRTTYVHQVPSVTRTYIPTVVVPQAAPVVQFQQQMPVPVPMPPMPPSKQLPRQPVTKVMIIRFLTLSQSIAKLEQKNIIYLYDSTIKRREELENEINILRQKCGELQSLIQSAPDLNKDTAAANLLGAAPEAELSPEAKAQQDAWINLDISKSQLEQLEVRLAKVIDQCSTLRNERNEYSDYCKEQDDILEQAFGGIYGSDLEDELEDKLDSFVKKQQYIKSYLDRCRVAKNMFAAASDQFDSCAHRWLNFVVNMPISTSYQYNMVKSRAISDIRNTLISANQNLSNAQRSLQYGRGALTLPFCTPQELSFVQQAINNILFDAANNVRQQGALKLYQRMAGRSAVLRDALATINERILSDLKQVVGESNKTRSQLRKERVGLMKELATGAGVEVDIDPAAVEVDADSASLQDEAALIEEAEVAKVEEKNSEEMEKEMEEAKAQISDGEVVAVVVADGEKDEKTPLDELAPAPSKNELIGSLDTIMAAYEEQKLTMQKEQEAAKAKQEARIKEKLRRKKSEQMKAIQE